MESFILNLLVGLVKGHPYFSAIVMVMGVLRAINKPLFMFIHSIVDATPTDADNKFVDQVEKSQVMKAINFILDYFGSIKLPK